MTRCNIIRLQLTLACAVLLTGCATFGSAPVYGEIPECPRLVPPSLIKPVEGVDVPVPEQWSDGHQKAEPWMLGYLGQTGQLDKANENPAAIYHIMTTCLDLHREGLARSKRGFWARFWSRAASLVR